MLGPSLTSPGPRLSTRAPTCPRLDTPPPFSGESKVSACLVMHCVHHKLLAGDEGWVWVDLTGVRDDTPLKTEEGGGIAGEW